MTPEARVQAGIELFGAVIDTDRPADASVAAYLRGRRYIGSKDRAAITGRLYAMLRHRARLGWWLGTLDAEDTPRARMIAWLVLGEAARLTDLDPLFAGGAYGPGPLSEPERRLAHGLYGKAPTDPGQPGPVRLELPDWAIGDLRAAFGDAEGRFAAEMAALLDEAPLDLRANLAACPPDRDATEFRAQLVHRLRSDGLDARPTPFSPLGIRVAGRPNIAAHRLFRDGVLEVQDEGSQIAALLVGAGPGQQVVDFCAGAGGKTLALAAQMGGRGRVVACDISEGRLARAKERIKRAGLDNVEPRLLDGARDKWVKRQKGKFDRVLIDAPCTGVGAWRRNPDARWRGGAVAELAENQADILASAARLVKPGGRLAYVTCSLLRAENQAQINRFLAGAEGFRPMDIPPVWRHALGGEPPPPALAAPGSVTLSPASTGTDGFFVALMERDPA